MNVKFEDFFPLDNFIAHYEKMNFLMNSKEPATVNKTREDLEKLFNQPVLEFLKALSDNGVISTIKLSEGHSTVTSTAWNKMIKKEPLDSQDEYRLGMLFDKVLLTTSMNYKKEPENIEFYKSKYSEFISKMNSGTFQHYEVENDGCKCYECGQRMLLVFKDWKSVFATYETTPDGKLNFKKLVQAKSCLDDNNVMLDINFPTGELIISDWVRVADFDKIVDYDGADKYDDKKSLSSKPGRIFLTENYAKKHNFICVSLDNNSPRIFQNKDTLLFGNVSEDNEKEQTNFKEIGSVCTDFWGVTIIDKQTLIDILAQKHGQEKSIEFVNEYLKKDTNHNLIYINPGQYTLEFNGNYEDFNKNYKTEEKNNINKCFSISRKEFKPTLKP